MGPRTVRRERAPRFEAAQRGQVRAIETAQDLVDGPAADRCDRPPGFDLARRRTVRIDGNDDRLAPIEPEVEPRPAGLIGRCLTVGGSAARHEREVRLTEAREHVADNATQRVRGRRRERPRAELVADLRPVDAVEGRIEVGVVHDLPDAIEGLDARFLSRGGCKA